MKKNKEDTDNWWQPALLIAVFGFIIGGIAGCASKEAYDKAEAKQAKIDSGAAEYYWDKNLNKHYRELPPKPCPRSHTTDDDDYLNWKYGTNKWKLFGDEIWIQKEGLIYTNLVGKTMAYWSAFYLLNDNRTNK